MRAVFFGTPAIAVPALRALAEVAEIVAVVCQPDRPAGRGLTLQPPAVKAAALELGIEVHQPVKVKTGNLDEWLRERTPDVALVMAYGRILPPAVLGAPRRGCMNLHASLLPRWRGAAPINWAIANGDTESGVCLMQMDEGLDTGPVFARLSVPIGPQETAGELAEQLAATAAQLVRESLALAVDGALVALPQAHEEMEAEFHHHPADTLPEFSMGQAKLRLLAGSAYGHTSPVRIFSPLFYAEAAIPAGASVSLPEGHEERGVYVMSGAISHDGETFEARSLLVFRPGGTPSVRAESDARVLLLGGAPPDGPRYIEWNFVSSSLERIERAKREWQAGLFPKVPGDAVEFIPLPPPRA